ncbi:MAG: urea carboxylase-associated family protein [Rhizobiales bacterium]|nr:urea carboxylase-associated family protein [Hyphomicrobiales bacterium]
MKVNQEKVTVKAGRGAQIPVHAGDMVTIINVSGTQVVDFWCFPKSSPQQYLSLEHCREVLGKIYFAPGDVLVSDRYEAVFDYVEDTAGGLHDTLIAPCNPEMYRRFGRPESSPSCTGNFWAAIAEAGIVFPFVPSPWNLFMRAAVSPDGTIIYARPPFKPDGRVVLKMRVDATIVVSACPDDCYPTNGGDGSPQDFVVQVAAMAATG